MSLLGYGMSSRRSEAVQIARSARHQAPQGFGDTIVAVPQHMPLRSLCVEDNETLQPQITPVQELFKIRLADSNGRREAAGLLVQRRYAWRGYDVGTTQGVHPNRITLSASNRDEVVATIAVGLDSVAGLFVDKLYGDELDPRVGAPAVLLRLDFAYAEKQIAEMGGRVEFAATKRSLYPYFFSVNEEAAIARRLRTVI